MKKHLPWKRVFVCAVIAVVCCMLIAEFGAVFWFFAAVFGAAALWTAGKTWWDVRRIGKAREDIENAREEARRQKTDRRREVCRKARYDREERRRVEAHIQQTLGPVKFWDTEEGAELLCLDTALVPPMEALPFWKAATVGAGACTIEDGCAAAPFRAELVMALPPDWDPSDPRPVRVLRDAVRHLLITEGFAGCNSVYRGFSAINAGFAGAVVTDEFPGLPDLGTAALPEGPSVCFFWLVPLLKPELDYFLQRGLAGLERRFPGSAPWADPARKPCADFGNWFQEDIAPFVWSEEGELYCLGLELGTWRRELFERPGYTDPAWGWEKLARAYLRRYQPEDLPFVEFACEERVFFAASRDEEILRRLALGLSDLLRDRPEEARRMLE